MKTTAMIPSALASLVICFCGLGITIHAQVSSLEIGSRPLIIGGHIPNWLIKYDPVLNAPLTPEQTKELPVYQLAVQQKAVELFDIVIPSYINWKASEPQAGRIDFRIYDAAAAWAVQNHKRTIVQHLFWEDPRTIPAWAKSLDAADLKRTMLNRIGYTHKLVGDVYGLTVLNEMLYFHYLRDRLGNDMVKSLFEEAKQAFPHTLLYLDENPWQRDIDPHDPDPAGTGMKRLSKLVNSLQADHVPFDRVGVQLYIGDRDIEAMGGVDAAVHQFKEAIDAFKSSTGLNVTILEFGFTSTDESNREQVVKRMLKMCQENRSVDGFFFYHWLNEQLPNNALVSKDGHLTPGGQAVLDFRLAQPR